MPEEQKYEIDEIKNNYQKFDKDEYIQLLKEI